MQYADKHSSFSMETPVLLCVCETSITVSVCDSQMKQQANHMIQTQLQTHYNVPTSDTLRSDRKHRNHVRLLRLIRFLLMEDVFKWSRLSPCVFVWGMCWGETVRAKLVFLPESDICVEEDGVSVETRGQLLAPRLSSVSRALSVSCQRTCSPVWLLWLGSVGVCLCVCVCLHHPALLARASQ